MANEVGPRISTNGIVFDLDATVSSSYSGTGLTAYGLIAATGATLVNGVSFSSNNNGYFSFDGVDDYINVSNPSSLQISTGTICVWCRTSSPGSSYRGIVAKQFAYGIFYTDSILTIYDWAIPRANSTGVNLADGNWKHVVFTFQNGVTNGSNVYVNNSNVATFTYNISSQIYNLFIGSEANSAQHSQCNISQVLIYNRVLSSSEISQNYNSSKRKYGL